LIRQCEAGDLDATRDLLREYAALVGEAICFTRFERELAELPGQYAPPQGRLLLGWIDGELAGCVALRVLSPEIAEMKRLYVRPAFRSSGLGRLLVDQVTADAREAGYRLLRLDTLPRFERALAMYRARGFYEIPRYGDNPDGAICFELPL